MLNIYSRSAKPTVNWKKKKDKKIYLGVLTIFLKTLIKVSSDKQPKLFVLKTKCLLHL